MTFQDFFALTPISFERFVNLDVTFKISCAAESLSLVKVNMSMRNLAELKRYTNCLFRNEIDVMKY